MSDQKYKKKTKEQIYEELKGMPAYTSLYDYDADHITSKLKQQILSQYPKTNENPTEFINTLKNLLNDMQLKNMDISYGGRRGFYQNEPTYLHNGESYNIDELPKESNPHSLTSFLGRFDPFRQKVPLTLKDRENDPIYYEPEGDSTVLPLVKMGLAKDFRTGRIPAKLEDKNFELDRPTTIDPRLLNAAYLKVNPQTLDEMITSPGTGKIRFKQLQQKLAEDKKRKDILNSIKEQQELEDAENELKNR